MPSIVVGERDRAGNIPSASGAANAAAATIAKAKRELSTHAEPRKTYARAMSLH